MIFIYDTNAIKCEIDNIFGLIVRTKSNFDLNQTFQMVGYLSLISPTHEMTHSCLWLPPPLNQRESHLKFDKSPIPLTVPLAHQK